MLGPSHSLIGASVGALTAQQLGAPILAGVCVGAVFGLVPDMDHPGSTLGRMLPKLWHKATPGHRLATHNPAFALALGWLLSLWSPRLGVLAGAGAFSHVLADAPTEDGCPWVYPLSRRRFALPRWLAFKTGGAVEVVVVAGVVVATGWWLVGLPLP